MWKSKEDERREFSQSSGTQAASRPEPMQPAKPLSTFAQNDSARIGKSVVIKGDVSGDEDLYFDGEVQGRIELRGHNLVIGTNGRVRADIQAKNITIRGQVNGKIAASEKVELAESAAVLGDISSARVRIEDGAGFKGSIETLREATGAQAEMKAAAAAAGAQSSANPSTGK